MSGCLPNCLIVGAQKSGTTSLSHYLSGHKDVFFKRKEVHFFDRFAERGLDWYKLQFAGADGARMVGESTPNYMYFEDIPRRMAQALPDARLIATLRNPVDRAYSHYWHCRSRGKERLDFAAAIAAEPERLATGDHSIRNRCSYLDRGRYLKQLRRICDYYPRESLMVVIFEEMIATPVGTFQAICRFLDIDDTHVPPNIGEAKNRFATFRSMRLRGLIRRLPIPLRRVAVRLNKRVSEYPSIDPELRARLLRSFEEENAELAAWLGRDLSMWGA